MRRNLQLRNAFLSFIVLVVTASSSFAQSGTIKGSVRDENGPLSGASVTVSSSKGTTTNESGNYELKVAPGRYNVSITYTGYQLYTTQITVGANQTVTADATLVISGGGEEIVLVGSRSTGRSKLTTPAPVDVIPIAQVINDIGQVEINQILNYIAPSFQSARQTVADGTDHLDPAQLRGLGTDQVLVLINGKRRHQSALVNVNGTVNRGQVSTDLSAIPATSIERIEILRDGASAQYGSDAIAGVINIILKKQTGILEAGVSYGGYISEYPKNYALYKLTGKRDDPNVKVTDGNTIQANIGYGFKIGSGYLNLNGEYINRDGTNRTGTYTGAVFPNVNGVNRDDSIMAARGITRNLFDLHAGNSKMNTGSVFYNFAIPAGSGEFYAFGGYSNKMGVATGLYRYPSSIPLASNAGKYANSVFAIYPNGFLPEIHSDITDFSTALGFRTKFNDWNFDVSNSFGLNTFKFGVENSVNYSQFANAGNTQRSFDAGGLRFYQNTINADLSRKYNTVLQGLNVAAGAEFRLDGFKLITGEEASYKNYDVPSGVAPGAQVFPGFVDSVGNKTRSATAAYVDMELDVTNDLLFTGAGRFENYSDFGSTFNYKLGMRYKFSDKVIFRGTFSTGFRAPSLQQRFYAKTNTLFITVAGSLTPVQAGTFTNESKLAGLLGIPKLKEETSKNVAAGFALKPLPGLEITIDGYLVYIDNRIILTNNFNGNTSAQIKAILDGAGANTANFFTNAIDTRASGLEGVVSYAKKIANKHSLRATLALSFVDNYVKSKTGKPAIHASDILINGGQLNNYFNREDQSRIEVANPRNKESFMVNYKYKKFGAMARLVRFGSVQYLDGSNSANPFANVIATNAFTGAPESTDQKFKAKIVTDVSVSYDITKSFTATIGANNIFDEYQDIQSHSNNQSLGRFVYSRRVEQMGYNGAYYFARLKLNLDPKK
jgi:iron complex outermembrane receptor protein